MQVRGCNSMMSSQEDESKIGQDNQLQVEVSEAESSTLRSMLAKRDQMMPFPTTAEEIERILQSG